MPKTSRLTPKQWQDLIEYYQSGRTLEECSRVYGFTRQYLGKKLNKMGVEVRDRFEPSRPEKWEKAPPHTKLENAHVINHAQVERVPESDVHSERQSSREHVPPKRKIILLTGENHNTYEKDYK